MLEWIEGDIENVDIFLETNGFEIIGHLLNKGYFGTDNYIVYTIKDDLVYIAEAGHSKVNGVEGMQILVSSVSKENLKGKIREVDKELDYLSLLNVLQKETLERLGGLAVVVTSDTN
jgi:hypothetical protein